MLRAAMFVVCGAAACAAGGVYSFNWDIENKTGLDAKDFHVTIVSDKPLSQSWSYDGKFGEPTVEKKAGGLVYDISWADGTVSNDGKTHVGFRFKGDKEAKVSVINVRWTGGDSRQIGTFDQQPTFPGWKVAAGTTPTFNVARNDDNSQTSEIDESTVNRDVVFSGTRFGWFSDEVPLDLMQKGLLSGPSESPFLVSTDGTYAGPYSTFGVVPDSGFVVSEFAASFTASAGTITSTVIMQIEVPQPGGVLVLGACATACVGLRRRRIMA